MNLHLASAFIRQRLTSPMRVVLLFAVFMIPLMISAFVPGVGLQSLGGAAQFALIFSAGLIGQDYSAGVLQLLFARPLRRSEYVISRWLAAAAAAAIVSLSQVALGYVFLGMRGHPPDSSQAAILAGNGVLEAFGVTAVITLFSSLAAGLVDLGIYVLIIFSSQLLQALGHALSSLAILARVGTEMERFTAAKLDLGQFKDLATVSWFSISSYASTVVFCIALAIVIVNRKELSYATG